VSSPLLAAGLARECDGCVDRDHPSRVDRRNAVAQSLGLLHEVRYEDDRHPAAADLLDQRPRVAARLRVEPGRELVEHCNLGRPISASAIDSRCF
jgi:hypothetical protein